MGSYEEEYKKYYAEAKARLNIKSNKKESAKKNKLQSNEILGIKPEVDIYPKTEYKYENINEDNKEVTDNSIYENKKYYLIESGMKKGTYSGIENYNGMNNYRGLEEYGGRSYYGNNGTGNKDKVEKTLIERIGNTFIIQLALTLVLFISVIALKNLPYKESATIYEACKEVVSNNFDYKVFIEDVKNINIKEEVEKIKVNLKIDELPSEEVNKKES